MSKQLSGLKRNTIDKFYTKGGVVALCIAHLQKNINIDRNDLIIEPSAGNGAFIDTIKTLSDNSLFLDIEPNHNSIKKQDFLKMDYSSIKSTYKNIHVLGNPPFGRQSCMAVKFIKYACKFAKTIAFILPKSFKKPSLQSKFPINFHLISSIDLPQNSFLINNREHDVPCVFQIWQRHPTKIRKIPKKLLPYFYKFVKKDEAPDISFRRVGAHAGKVETVISSQSPQSHYFIKFDSYNSDIVELIKNIDFKHDNTVGPRSISKQELIKKVNAIYSKNVA